MGTLSLFGNDTIKFNERLLTDFGSGEVAKISYPTELATVKTGKSGNAVFVQNASGFQATLELKVIRGSGDDKFIQSLVTSYRSDPVLFVLANAELVKLIGSGVAGTPATNDTYILTGGVPTKQVEVVSNVEGDTEQALSVYTWAFAVSDRALS
jgi:hypothetical protein